MKEMVKKYLAGKQVTTMFSPSGSLFVTIIHGNHSTILVLMRIQRRGAGVWTPPHPDTLEITKLPSQYSLLSRWCPTFRGFWSSPPSTKKPLSELAPLWQNFLDPRMTILVQFYVSSSMWCGLVFDCGIKSSYSLAFLLNTVVTEILAKFYFREIRD